MPRPGPRPRQPLALSPLLKRKATVSGSPAQKAAPPARGRASSAAGLVKRQLLPFMAAEAPPLKTRREEQGNMLLLLLVALV